MLLFALATCLLPFTLADVHFVQPAAGSLFKAGTTPTVSWQDSGLPPSLSAMTNYVLNLCAGGNSKGSYMCPLAVLKADGTLVGSNIASGLTAIPAAVGGDSINGYFLQMVSTTATGARVYNYSPRFGITGMKGSFTADVAAGIKAVGSNTQGPPRAKDAGDTDDNAPSSVAPDGAFGIPYTEQHGSIRYAPMQPQPPSKITATRASAQWPTSYVEHVATTFLPIPRILTTITQSQTFSVHSRENTASPAPDPQDEMAKWLARWRD